MIHCKNKICSYTLYNLFLQFQPVNFILNNKKMSSRSDSKLNVESKVWIKQYFKDNESIIGTKLSETVFKNMQTIFKEKFPK